jgi:hypothetical protein
MCTLFMAASIPAGMVAQRVDHEASANRKKSQSAPFRHYGAPIEQPDCRLHGIGNAPMAWCTTLHALTKSEVRSEVPCDLASLPSLNIRN